MENTEIQYSFPGTIYMSVALFLFLIVSPILLDVMAIQAMLRGKFFAVFFIIFVTLIMLLFLPLIILILKSIKSSINNQPAIVLTPHFYIDNFENIQLQWKDISNIYITTDKSTFLKIAVADNAMVYSQATNSISRFFYWINSLNGGILSINMTLLKGKNQEILRIIKEYHEKVNK